MIEQSQTISAYAKINLHLQVLNKREDGYHNLLSLMLKIGFHDLLKCEKAETGDSVPLPYPEVIIRSATGINRAIVENLSSESNLITRSGYAYLLKSGLCRRFLVDVEKNIPAGAGLGGGSTDAAGMLKILHDMTGVLGENDLMEIARGLGADVPFCMQNCPAICEGIGDVVTPLSGSPGCSVVVVNNGIHVNTRNAYILLGRTRYCTVTGSEIDRKKKLIRKFVSTGNIAIAKEEFVNDFEKAVFSMHPEVALMKQDVYNSGADFAIMTGSGSSVVGLFSENETAVRAAAILSKTYSFVRCTGIIS